MGLVAGWSVARLKEILGINDCIHDNIPGEITLVEEKAVPTTSDEILLEDAAANNAKKKMSLLNMPGIAGIDTTAIHIGEDAEISAISTSKTPAIGADLLVIEDSTDGFSKAQITISNLPFNNYTHPNHSGDVTSTGDGATVIAAGAVDLAMQADMTAQAVICNATSGAAAPQAIALAAGQVLVGKASSLAAQQIKNAQVDATAAIAQSKLADDVPVAKMADSADGTLMGNDTGLAAYARGYTYAQVRAFFDLAYFDVYDALGGVTMTSGAVFDLDTTRETSGDFSETGGVITINKTGKFLITCSVTIGVAAGATSRTGADSYLRLNTGGGMTAIPGKEATHYCRVAGTPATTGCIVAIVDITSGESVDLYGIRTSGSETVESQAGMTSMCITELLV